MEDHLSLCLVEEDRYDEFMDHISRDFFPRESLALGSGLVKNHTADEVREVFGQYLSHGISLAVIDRRTDRIVATALNRFVDQSDPPPSAQDIQELPPELQSIFAFLAHLEDGYDVYEQCGAQRGIELLFLCVQDGYGGRGIARKLTEETIDLAAKQSDVAFVESNPTAPATCHLFRSLDFETVSEMRPVDYSIDGRPAFPYALPQDLTRFTVLKLQKDR